MGTQWIAAVRWESVGTQGSSRDKYSYPADGSVTGVAMFAMSRDKYFYSGDYSVTGESVYTMWRDK